MSEPVKAMKLIYRTDKRSRVQSLPPEYRFHIAGNLSEVIPLAGAVFKTNGLRGLAKTLAKIATPSRAYYVITRNSRIVSDGWIMFGHCESYKIGKEDHVIGPINTVSSEQGRGLASAALTRGVNYCIQKGARFIYIDTLDTNLSSQRTILKSGMELYRTA